MSEFVFLKEEEIVGNEQLKVFKDYGSKAAITDFAILLGGSFSSVSFVDDSNSLKDRGGYYFTGSFEKYGGVEVVNGEGKMLHADTIKTNYGGRPACYFFDIVYHDVFLHEVINWRDVGDVREVEWGEFPQSVVSDEIAEKLNEEFRMYVQFKNTPLANQIGISKMKPTGKFYNFDSIKYFQNKPFALDSLEEFAYNDRKYVHVTTNSTLTDFSKLSNGRTVNPSTSYWVEVEPIIWLMDDKTRTIITKKVIFAGVPFNNALRPKRKFSSNTIGQYLKKIFVKDMKPGEGPVAKRNDDYQNEYVVSTNEVKTEEKEKVSVEREVAVDFDFSEVNDKEMIKGTIDSDISVFLHGKSSDGKSARVKQIDPNCEIVYLRNATPDSLNGKSVYNAAKGEMIDVPPTWYKKIREKCEAEPDKIHIVFFDELTNALPSIQGMAFNIILDKEVNGTWKLPSNCRIVAAGNDLDDSLAANEMAGPLFNRFSHVYIETTVEKWLRWAAKPENNIHPAIYAYVAYKSCSRSDVLRTAYDGKKPNADPRKWEMASKVLHATKNPEMLRSLIGQSLTADFIQFCKHSVITLEDVVNGNYNNEDIKSMNLSEKYATSIGLSKCEKKDLEVVRSFVSKLGAEVLATFDVLVSYKKEEKTSVIRQDNKRR